MLGHHEIGYWYAHQRLANRRNAAVGKVWVPGVRAFGYDETGTKIIDIEAAVIRDAAQRVLAGESLRSIVADLREREVRTSVGGQWSQHSLSRMLRNPRMAGIRVYRGENLGKAEWKGVFDEKTHKKLVALLDDPSRRSPHATNVRKYLLSGGFLICGYPMPDTEPGICGKPMQAQPSNGGKRGYVCRKGSPSYGCGRIRISAEALEEETAARAAARLGAKNVRARLERAVGSARDGDEPISQAIAAIEERTAEAGREYARKQISMSTLKAIEAAARAEQRVLREQLAQAERLNSMPATTPQGLSAWWLDAPLERRRDMLRLVLEKIIVRPASRRGFISLDIGRLEWVWK